MLGLSCCEVCKCLITICFVHLMLTIKKESLWTCSLSQRPLNIGHLMFRGPHTRGSSIKPSEASRSLLHLSPHPYMQGGAVCGALCRFSGNGQGRCWAIMPAGEGRMGHVAASGQCVLRGVGNSPHPRKKGASQRKNLKIHLCERCLGDPNISGSKTSPN